jgi:hypothetical protein
LKAKSELARQQAVKMLAAIGMHNSEDKGALMETALRDESDETRLAAARQALDLLVDLDEEAVLTAIVTDGYVVTSIYEELDGIADQMRPRQGARRGKARPNARPLMPFPWPPPRYSSMGKFGKDFPLSWLGDEETRLDALYQRLYAALKAADRNFEARLFGVPGGFALLTSVEQTERDGTPLPAKYRFAEGSVPPLNLADYLAKLFTDPPSARRQLAFVVTDEANFGVSDRQVPDFTLGGDTLPDEIARQKLRDKNVYVLVYAWERRSGEAAHSLTGLSAATHLAVSGLMKVLQK